MREEKDYRKQRESCQQQDQEADYAQPSEDTDTDRGWGEAGVCLYSLPEKRYSKKSRLMKKADAVLGPMLKRLGIESGVRLERIRNDWFDIFDPSLSSHMFPSSCTEHELLLNVDSPAWIQQLTYYKKDIIRKLSLFGVTEVRFRLGKVRKKKQHDTTKKNSRELSDNDVSFASSVVADIRDEHLKEAIRKAIEKSLASVKTP